jgi:CheY-like chemotaxis protein
MRVLIVEDELYLAEAIRDGLRLEAIAADIAGDGDLALEQLSINSYDVVVLDRDIPGPTGDEIARHLAGEAQSPRVLMLTAADRLDDKATGFESLLRCASSCCACARWAEGRRRARRRSSRSPACAWIASAGKCSATTGTSRSHASSSRCSTCS